MSVESNSRFALVLLYFALWLVKTSRATFSTNQKQNSNQLRLARTRFPALGASDMYLLRVLIGLLDNLCLLWLAGIITLVLVLRHSFEKRSNYFGFGFTILIWKALYLAAFLPKLQLVNLVPRLAISRFRVFLPRSCINKSVCQIKVLLIFAKRSPDFHSGQTQKSYVTSGLSEPWSLNQFKSLRARSSYENDAQHVPANRISRRQNLWMTITSFLTHIQRKKLNFQKRR